MKKLLTACAACVLAGMVSAQVESVNVVGYKADVAVAANNYTMLSAPFTTVGGGAVPIASLFADNSGFTASDTSTSADNILVWNGAGYNIYFFSSDAGNAWASGEDSFSETTDTIPAGSAFWFYRRGAALADLTVAGEVLASNITVSVAANNYTMVSDPFAADMPIASITAPDLTASDTSTSADNVLVWNGAGYNTYFYSSDAGNAWASGEDSFSETTDAIPPSGAFWFYRRGGATTLTLPVPYTL